MIGDLGTVYVAEIMRRIKSRPFILGVVVGVFAIILIFKLPSLLRGTIEGSQGTVLVGAPSLTTPAKKLLANDYRILGVISSARLTTRCSSATTLVKRSHCAATLQDCISPSMHTIRTVSDKANCAATCCRCSSN